MAHKNFMEFDCVDKTDCRERYTLQVFRDVTVLFKNHPETTFISFDLIVGYAYLIDKRYMYLLCEQYGLEFTIIDNENELSRCCFERKKKKLYRK